MMKNTTLRGVAIVAILIATVVVTVWAISYHPFEFKGGMGIRDSGFFSYPRYHAQLGEFPLWKNGEDSFTVHGLPSGPLDLELEVSDTGSRDRAALESLPISMNVSITDVIKKEICTASGVLSNAKSGNRAGWVLSSSVSQASFWHTGCLQLPVSRFETYTLKVVLSGAHDRSPHKMLRPVLAGGGNELP
jgi:hypothetical protein